MLQLRSRCCTNRHRFDSPDQMLCCLDTETGSLEAEKNIQWYHYSLGTVSLVFDFIVIKSTVVEISIK